ncbi:MAG: HAD-IA family hydrolase [Verrucomicrobiota bacterium]
MSDDDEMEVKARRLIIFDFDGTLAATLEAGFSLVNELAPEYGFEPISQERALELRAMRTREAIMSLGIPARSIPKLLKEVRAALRNRMDEIRPVEGIVEALTALRGRGVRLGILTSNSKENVRIFLDHWGMGGMFDFVTAGSTLFGKVRLLRRAHEAEAVGLELGDVLYVGDETRDIHAAQRAGMRSVAVSWGLNTRGALEAVGPDVILDEPADLVALFDGR